MDTIDTSVKPHDAIFASKTQWRLEAKGFDLLGWYATHVDTDYYNKELHVHALDVYINGRPVTEDWVRSLIHSSAGTDEVLTLTQFDSKGEVLIKHVFEELRVIGHKCERDYEIDNTFAVEHLIMFQYGKKTIPE